MERKTQASEESASDIFIKKVILEMFQKQKIQKSKPIYLFLEYVMGFNKVTIALGITELCSMRKLRHSINSSDIIRNFEPEEEVERSAISLEANLVMMRNRVLENNGFFSKKEIDFFRKDDSAGGEARRLIWHLINTERAVLTWDGRLVLVARKERK